MQSIASKVSFPQSKQFFLLGYKNKEHAMQDFVLIDWVVGLHGKLFSTRS